MKKREWDKDFQNLKALVTKNKAPFMILGCLILILITYGIVSLFIRWFSDVNEVFSGSLSIENKFDFVTPALYYFSSIAQTMGAIIGLALAAMYAIMPNIRSSKDNPAFEPARRLLQRDEYFRRSINFGSVCILVSIIGLLFIYVTASSQSWAFILLLILGVTALGLGVYSLGTMFYFIRVRMPKYFSPVEILEFAFENGDPNKIRAMNEHDALDYAEICLFCDIMDIKSSYTKCSALILNQVINSRNEIDLSNKYRELTIILFNKMIRESEKVGVKQSINKNETIINSLISFWESMGDCFVKNNKYQFQFKSVIDAYINIYLNYEYFSYDYDWDYLLKKLDINPFLNSFSVDCTSSYDLYIIFQSLSLYLHIYKKIKVYSINRIIYLFWVNRETYKKYSIIFSQKIDELLESLVYIFNNNISKIEECLDINADTSVFINNIISLKQQLINVDILKNSSPVYRSNPIFLFLINYSPIVEINFSPFKLYEYPNYFDEYILKCDFKNMFYIYKNVSGKNTLKFTEFIYFHFIPYLERHGINVYDNPEYLAIIRKRIKDIKEPELGF